MPGQVTHFYLAARLAQQFPQSGFKGYIRRGFEEWIDLNKKFNRNTIKLAETKPGDGEKDMQILLNKYREDILKNDDIAIFSAFCTGAVGPDLWTVPAKLKNITNIEGSFFFDMGHYNLSHCFPQYVIEKLNSGSSSGWQKKYETAYILGYLSHISMDILGHLKVNVFAGAYHNQQSDVWENENGNLTVGMWNNHNKIEHYLDAFIRFFCFEGWYDNEIFAKHEDYEKFKEFNNIVNNDFGQHEKWYFPNYTDYYSKIMKFGRVIKTNGINNYPDECFLDLATSLAAPFANRYFIGSEKRVTPFIRDYCWSAYENKLDEWFKRGKKSLAELEDETIKVEYFNFIDVNGHVIPRDKPINTNFTTQYYYLQTVIPDLNKVTKYTEDFYSPAAFGHFIQGAMKIADSFIEKALNNEPLDFLNNWNLDTGMAIRLKKCQNERYTAAITIDLQSVLELPELNGWDIPTLKRINTPETKSWPTPVPEALEESELEEQKSSFKTHNKYSLTKRAAIGVEIKVKNTPFYEFKSENEISAFIFGNDTNFQKPWIIQGEEHGAQQGYNISECIEDFKSDYALIKDVDANKKIKLYRTVFVGGLKKKKYETAKNFFDMIDDRYLPRHIKISTCRKFINYVRDNSTEYKNNDNFSPNLLGSYNTIYPSEDMVLSLFIVLKKCSEYQDVFYQNVTFTENEIESLKKIHVIGINTVLIIFIAEGKNVVLHEAWIDGERQKIEET